MKVVKEGRKKCVRSENLEYIIACRFRELEFLRMRQSREKHLSHFANKKII
jgi:hypothetical protein